MRRLIITKGVEEVTTIFPTNSEGALGNISLVNFAAWPRGGKEIRTCASWTPLLSNKVAVSVAAVSDGLATAMPTSRRDGFGSASGYSRIAKIVDCCDDVTGGTPTAEIVRPDEFINMNILDAQTGTELVTFAHPVLSGS